MGRPVATLGDMHTCPLHGGGPILDPGQTGVTIDGLPVAVVGGTCLCGTSGTDGLASGSPTVRINGKAVMRVGDMTRHGGLVATGKPTVNAA